MLYMEDYLEMIEHLPQDLKDRFTEIRELDLQVQNTTEKLDDRVKAFFSNAKKMRVSERDTEYENIRNEYYKVLEDADEKVHQSNQLYDLVDRYLRRLDQELHKFKMELEADNAGITEVLEKRSLALDEPPPQPKLKQKDRERGNGHPSSQKENRLITAGVQVKSEKKGERKVSVEKTPVSNAAQIAGSSSTPVLSYNIGHTVPGGHALVAAASQAIAATQQLQQGRRTAGLNKSTYFDGINSSVIPAELNFLNNAEFHQAAQQALAATTGTSASTVDQKRNKRKSLYSQNQEVTPPPQDEVIEEATIDDAPETPEWNSDPSEPRYCICNQVSYGDMVACDNANCPIEWFHYPCVGIVSTPKGKWYCSSCSATVKRRGRR